MFVLIRQVVKVDTVTVLVLLSLRGPLSTVISISIAVSFPIQVCILNESPDATWAPFFMDYFTSDSLTFGSEIFKALNLLRIIS